MLLRTKMENPKVRHKKGDTEEKMAIWDYADYFHDGRVFEINHNGKNVVIFMESAELDTEDLMGDVKLTKDDCLKGKLHIEGVRSIKINDADFFDQIKKIPESNDLLHFGIKEGKVLLEVGWLEINPTCYNLSAFEIQAEKIWWENLPE